MEINMDKVWWGRVPNAMAFVHDITENLLDEKSIILQSNQSIPWYHFMMSQVKEMVMQQNASKRFEIICDVNEPGQYLLTEFCKLEKRAAYRPSKSFARFFAESDDIVMHSRYFWVNLDSLEALDRWITFVAEYIREREKNKETAVFILEWIGEKIKVSRKGIRQIFFDEYINEYDRMVFSMIASSGIKDVIEIKNYLAELASIVSGNDIELIAACLGGHKEFLRDPYAMIGKIIDARCRSDGTRFQYRRSREEIKQCIWKAQIKTIYPLLEEFRGGFVEKYNTEIAKELPISSSYGEFYTDPKDVELGTLVFMVDNGKLQLSFKEYTKLRKFKDARNRLSHLNILTIDEMMTLLV